MYQALWITLQEKKKMDQVLADTEVTFWMEPEQRMKNMYTV